MTHRLSDRHLTDYLAAKIKKEETPKITSSAPAKQVKLKDPKRVAVGKRLAAISKTAKEKKARERFEAETSNECDDDTSYNINFGYVVGIVGVVAALRSLYYAYKQDIQESLSIHGRAKPSDVRSSL